LKAGKSKSDEIIRTEAKLDESNG